ncbi:hypothetical protein ACLOJK_034221 [Asimina triloba]
MGNSNTVYPLVIASHPSEPNQIGLGMSDGTVHVVEPPDAEPKWGASPPQDNGPLPSLPPNAALNSQTSEPPPSMTTGGKRPFAQRHTQRRTLLIISSEAPAAKLHPISCDKSLTCTGG